MSRSAPRQLAERCFALARSTSFPPEREAAISRGLAICARSGLDLDGFDIPGRQRGRERERVDWGAGGGRAEAGAFSGAQYTRDEHAALMAAFRRHMANGSAFRAAMGEFGFSLDRATASAGARDGETAYDARRRNFEQAAADARERDARREAGRR